MAIPLSQAANMEKGILQKRHMLALVLECTTTTHTWNMACGWSALDQISASILTEGKST